MIGTILAVVGGRPSDHPVLDAALDVARRFEAHVKVLHVRAEAWPALYSSPEGMASAAELIAAIERDNAALAATASRHFAEWRSSAALELAASPASPRRASTEWHEVSGDTAEVIASEARLADLVVISREPGINELSMEAALFDGGRPVLSVPPSSKARLFERALVAWKASSEAARAIANALPVLKKTQRVEIFAVSDDDLSPLPAQEIRQYLAWHEIEGSLIEERSSRASAGEALLDAAHRHQSTLIVLGAFSHSRLRELVLGGVTRHVLKHADIPLLMSH